MHSHDADSDDSEMDEVGMARLINALGEEGLNEYDQAQLLALERDGNFSEDGDEASESEAEGADEQENISGQVLEEDSPEDLVALDEVDSVDEDAVPRQKIEIDNKVSLDCLFRLRHYRNPKLCRLP